MRARGHSAGLARARSAISALMVVAAMVTPSLGVAACGDAKADQDNTGHPTKGTVSNGGSPISTPENMRQEHGPDN